MLNDFDKMYIENERLVYKFATKYKLLNDEDMMQNLKMAMFRAITKFDPSRGIALSTYVYIALFHEYKYSFRDKHLKLSFVNNIVSDDDNKESDIFDFVMELFMNGFIPDSRINQYNITLKGYSKFTICLRCDSSVSISSNIASYALDQTPDTSKPTLNQVLQIPEYNNKKYYKYTYEIEDPTVEHTINIMSYVTYYYRDIEGYFYISESECD